MEKISNAGKKLSSNMEDYLETIYVLHNKNGTVRVKDISDAMDVRKSSVNYAVNVLAGKNLIKHENYGHILLTPEGEHLSRDIKKRHDLIIKFLSGILGVNRRVAEKDACMIEHVISQETNDSLSKFVEFIDTFPPGEDKVWMKKMRHYIKKQKIS